MFVGRVVVADDVDVEPCGNFAVDLAEALEPFAVRVSRHELLST
jgi:hypothetical protein